MIHEAKIEYCVVVEYPDGYKFCKAKFMYEEDAGRYLRTRKRTKKKEFVSWKLYERRDRMDGVTWTELK